MKNSLVQYDSIIIIIIIIIIIGKYEIYVLRSS